MALILCIPSDVASNLFNIVKISLTVQSFRTVTIFIPNIPKDNNYEKKMVGYGSYSLPIVG